MSLCGCDTRHPRPDLLFICHSALFYGLKWKHNMDVWKWLYRLSMNHQLIQWYSTYQAYSFTFKKGQIWTKKWSLLFLRLTCEARNECVFSRWSRHPNLLENLFQSLSALSGNVSSHSILLPLKRFHCRSNIWALLHSVVRKTGTSLSTGFWTGLVYNTARASYTG